MNGFDLSALATYTDELLMPLIRASVLEGRTPSLITVQPDIKSTAAINLLSGPIVAQDGSSCGFSATGGTELSQRDLEVCKLKVQEEYCLNDLENYYTQKMMNPGSYNEDIPFEQMFAEEKVARMQELNEKLIWQGNTAAGGQLALCDGFIKLFDNEAAVVDGNPDSYTAITVSNIIDIVDTMVNTMATEAVDMVDSNDLTLFVGYDFFRLYAQALRNANLYNYPSTADGTQSFDLVIPGTNVTMRAVAGLNGTNKVVLVEAANLYLGVDLLNDYEQFRLWYSMDNDTVRFHARWKQGVQVAFPERVIYFSL